MAILKCKMCGGDILLSEDKTTGTCDHCGSAMTFPRVSDEQKLNLYNRANHFRRQNEFDKAITAYERMIPTPKPIGARCFPGMASSTWKTR